ncbi:serine hydrolase domain-containing protein [Sphingomonas baiyangensis]|uniref:Beta-lactamase family protein n=1 Tax=Sphingomonas baiyangensis TaxID=2572576 RepID=A0A4U1L475_9SPHN|nr:serine hydrolase domain-containing protein [Sphingomonas baiyangensis]TKD51050.1 beta-lactamase family protein [Sphingomonas baiyangensis]
MTIAAIARAAFVPALSAVEAGRIPGATLGVVTAGGHRHVETSGLAQRIPTPEPLTRGHWFDLASLTKVIATAPTILRLADAGALDLDRPIADVIPDLRQYDPAGAAERRITVRECLMHDTHLPAVEPIYTYGDDPWRLRHFVLQREWRAGPPVYSDINYILLSIAIERLTGGTMAELPMPPGLGWASDAAISVATEYCQWRRRILKGEVHDENAFALGGAAGHAGLFGTVDGVLDFAQALLDGSGASTAALGAMRSANARGRSCGWEVRIPGWPGGDACSSATIGHTGFTGTGLWLDFDRGIGWTLLTNRVHPTRHFDSGIFALRPATGDALIAAWDAATARSDRRGG